MGWSISRAREEAEEGAWRAPEGARVAHPREKKAPGEFSGSPQFPNGREKQSGSASMKQGLRWEEMVSGRARGGPDWIPGGIYAWKGLEGAAQGLAESPSWRCPRKNWRWHSVLWAGEKGLGTAWTQRHRRPFPASVILTGCVWNYHLCSLGILPNFLPCLRLSMYSCAWI